MRPAKKIVAATLAAAALTLPAAFLSAQELPKMTIEQKLARYKKVALRTDMGQLSVAERRMLVLLITAAKQMNYAFWMQAYGDREKARGLVGGKMAEYMEINYGPWDRLDDNKPFVPGVGPKPPGAAFYPVDMTLAELEEAAKTNPALKSQYTMVRRDKNGKLEAVPYSKAFEEHFKNAAEMLRQASQLAEDPGLAKYLSLRAEALLTDNYQPSDFAWMDMKDNRLDIVIGPIESYEDALAGIKTAAEAYVLVKDMEWSKRLQRYAAVLPELQKGLPVPAEYKKEKPGSDADLAAYDVVFYAGDCNAGGKTIAINLPNDEEVQLKKGARRLQLKNAMKAKFDAILKPIAELIMVPDQKDQITFEAFFADTMFHEVAHGLGIKNTIDGKTTVREALGEHFAALEEGKADVLGLYMIHSLHKKGEDVGATLEAADATFVAGIFRSIRFGAASAHGVANLIRFNYFEEKGAFGRDAEGRYKVDYPKLRQATNDLSEKILKLQGDGDKKAVADFVAKYGKIGPTLQSDLDRINAAGVPVDVIFHQGLDVLGLL
jgi:hypothetical protein